MDKYNNVNECFLYHPEFSDFRSKILKKSDDRPLFVGVGFYSLMKSSSSGGFIGQLGRDIAGVAVAGLPGLILAQGTSGSDFFGNIVILLYYEGSISLVDLGYFPLAGGNYEEATLTKNWQTLLKNSEVEPKIMSFLLKDIDIDYEKYENYSLSIKPQEENFKDSLFEFPLKITFPLSKPDYQNQKPKSLLGTVGTRKIVDQFYGTAGFLDPKTFIEILKTRKLKTWSVAEENRFIDYSKNKHFMHKFMDEYDKLSGAARRKILSEVFPSFPDELKTVIHQHFIQSAKGQSKHSIFTKILFFLGSGLTIAGLVSLPFIDLVNGYVEGAGTKVVDKYTIPYFVISLGLLFLFPCMLLQKVARTKWYIKNLKFSQQTLQSK